MSKDIERDNDTAKKIKAAIEYCEPHLDQMWAARIVGILLGCSFRDAKDHMKYFYDWYERKVE